MTFPCKAKTGKSRRGVELGDKMHRLHTLAAIMGIIDVDPFVMGLTQAHTEDQPELRNVSEGTLPISVSEAASGLRRAGGTAADIARPSLAFKASAVERQ
jgi:hypothetical protein